MSRVISDGLKISNDFEINHFEFWVEFNMEGFPVEARNIVQLQTKRVLKYFKNIFIFNTFQDEEITNEDDDWKLLKDFAKNAIADKSDYDLCKR